MHAIALQDPFFAPVEPRVVANLMEAYQVERANIERIEDLLRSTARAALGYYLDNYCREGRVRPNVDAVFEKAGAIAALNADFWQRALDLTQVLDLMPQARRETWQEAIRKLKTPDFSLETVVPTIEDLLASRGKYFAERIAGIFFGLSGNHSTNKPVGFGRRLILADVFYYHGSPNTSKAGYINDLRAVVARFMGNEEHRWNVTFNDLDRLRARPGVWHVLDGGALRLKVFKCGTAHLEIHPLMVDRLNGVLASIYPRAIPATQRTAPKRPAKAYALLVRPLPFSVLHVLRDMRNDRQAASGTRWAFSYESMTRDPRAFTESVEVLAAIGGVREGRYDIVFAYDVRSVIDQIILSGSIPEQRSHQYYPTPESIADRVIDAAEIGDESRCLEPSAGQGALADRMPTDRTLCVEISELHCRVLRAKGHHSLNVMVPY
jgi:hypothetical protein